MMLRTSLFALGLAVAVHAQNTLPCVPATGTVYGWIPPAAASQLYFNLTVNTTVTLQGLEFTVAAPPDTVGTVELWVTNPGTTTHVGNENNAAVWSLAASGPSTVPIAPGAPNVVFTAGVVLNPGTYGIAIRHNNLSPLFVLGNGTNQAFSNADLAVNAGSITAGAFAGGVNTPFVWRGVIHYANGNVAHSPATKKEYGTGCYATYGSFFQRTDTAAATAASLNGRAISLLFNGIGYTVVPAVGVSYIPPSGGATLLPAGDDTENAVTLPSPLLHPTGIATQLFVHTNGYISTASNNTMPGTNNWTPASNGLLEAANTVWALAWHDFNSAELNSGRIKHELVGNLFCITWDNVESYPGSATVNTPNASTVQAQFDLSTGFVHYVWQSMTAVGGSADYDATLVGFSPGGPSPKPDPTDIVTFAFVNLIAPEVYPLTLKADVAPELGATVNLTTSNELTPGFGVNFLSTVQIPAPGVDLGIIGAPGCPGLLDINAGINVAISNLGVPFPGMVVGLPIPLNPALSGFMVVSQSAWLDPTANPFGVRTSNGVELILGTFGF